LDVHATGLGRDANSVAEYLDNTLPAEQLSDFERVCLESDAHLSEVAACHHILTLVLGEPASVPEGLKDKIYRQPHQRPAAPTPTAPTAGAVSAPAEPRTTSDEDVSALLGEVPRPVASRVDAASAGKPLAEGGDEGEWDEDERWTEAPDYLKRPRQTRWKPVALSVLVAFCLIMAVLRGMGPLDRNHPLAQRMGWGPADEVATSQEGTPSATQEGTAETPGDRPTQTGTTPLPEEPAAPSPTAPTAPAAQDEQVPGGEATPPPITPAGPERETPELDGSELGAPDEALPPLDSPTPPTGRARTPGPDEAVPTTTERDLADTSDAVDAAAEPGQPERREGPTLINPLAVDRTTDRGPAVPVPPIPTPRLQPGGDTAPPSDVAPAEPPADAASAPPPPARVLEIGRFLDRQQVLITMDATLGQWRRVPDGTLLKAGDLLMSLPTYRSPLVLASGMQVTLIGGTRVEVLEPDDRGTPFLQLDFGRLAVATVGQAGTTIGLRWSPDHSGILTLADMNTTLAVELHSQYRPGELPEQGPPHQMLHIYVTSGSAEWASAPTPPINIGAGQRLTLIDQYPALLKDLPQVPAWFDGRDARPRDPMAARDLAERLGTDRPLPLMLREEAESKQREVRSLAVCSLAYLGEFDPLIAALNDVRLYAYWPAEYEVLVRASGISEDFAASVRKTLIDRHGEADGERLYRILWSYNAAQLAATGAAELVECLDHPSYDFRIVASEQLKSITGQASLYRANANERDPQRRAAVTRWQKALESGEITYAQPAEIEQLLDEAAAGR
jgi:hypothetical protein